MPASPPTTSTSPDDHVAEHIPWDHLTIQPPPDRRRVWYGIAFAIGALAVAIVVVRAFDRPRPLLEPVLVDPTPATTAAVSGAAAPPPTAPLVPPPATDVLSEADLMAVDRVRLERSVAARAEAFTLEFFTLDPGDDWQARTASAAGRPLAEDVAPEAPETATVSYVEWVSTVDVEERGAGSYTVVVAMRRLAAADGATYVRLPVEWVELRVELDAAGVPRAGSLPAIIPVPQVDGDVLGGAGRFVDGAGIDWPSSAP